MMAAFSILLLFCAIINFCNPCDLLKKTCPVVLKQTSDTDVSSYGLLKYLTSPTKYDHMPPGILNITAKTFLYHAQVVQNLHYNLHMLLQLRYCDPRLAYGSITPNISEIKGDAELQNMIWTPHVYFVNDQRSALMGSLKKDIMVSVLPDGTVVFEQRLKTMLTCWMKLHKFPFDEQQCVLMLESWVYDSKKILLQWDEDNPVAMTPNVHMPEFYISNMWTNKNNKTDFYSSDDFELRLASGNYSALMVTFQLRRRIGFYIMDYYIPSMLLVVISWVSFWLDPNAFSGRIILGVSTMLTLIALSSKTSSAVPKASYILASEVWFIVCTAFIIGSLVEFAFVNVIWRRDEKVQLKKANSKYILKSTLTPKIIRKEFDQQKTAVERSISSPPHYIPMRNRLPMPFTAQGPSGLLDIPKLLYIQDEELEYEGGHVMRLISEDEEAITSSFTTMTSQQIANWIDRKSRIVFPISFCLFNIIYWGGMIFYETDQLQIS